MPDNQPVPEDPISDVKACGFLVLRRKPRVSFLLMRHVDRWDLPKGHIDADETDIVCAFRELEEETGIPAEAIQRDMGFRYTTQYFVRHKRPGDRRLRKTLVVFLGWLQRDVDIEPTEHPGYEWFDWSPPHKIQTQTIDPLLAAVEEHLSGEL